jgi:hypothetical protein
MAERCKPTSTKLGRKHHSENMVILNFRVRLSDRRMHIRGYSHSLRHPSRRLDALIVTKNLARFGPEGHIQVQVRLQDLFF